MNKFKLSMVYLSMSLIVWANKSPVLSLEQMEENSSFIADGQIMASKVIETETFNHPDGNLFVNRKYEGHFKIQQIIKSEISNDKLEKLGRVLILRYWHTDDNRYRGDMGPLLRVGDQFRLYSSVLSVENEELIAYVVSENNVRPEAYDFEERAKAPMEIPPTPSAPAVEEVAQGSVALKSAIEEVVTVKPSAEPTEQSSQGWLWLIGLLAVVGGLGLVLRRKN